MSKEPLCKQELPPELRPETEAFRKNWAVRIRTGVKFYRKGQARPESAWQGYEACRELAKSSNWYWLNPDDLERGKQELWCPLTARLAREVYFYKKFANKVIPINLAFKDAIDLLQSTLNSFRKMESAKSSHVHGIVEELMGFRLRFETALPRLEARREAYWETVLTTMPGLFWPSVEGITLLGPIATSPPEPLFDKVDYPRELLRRIDLDRRFQRRVATILRQYLPQHDFEKLSNEALLRAQFGSERRRDRISLATIARLTILTYIAGELGTENRTKSGVVVLKVTGRTNPISFRGVRNMLWNAGLR